MNKKTKTKSKSCGLFVFNKEKKVLLTNDDGRETWWVPSLVHKNNEDYLQVALKAMWEQTGIDFFNYEEDHFRPLKHQFDNNHELIPFVIFGEKTVDKFKCNDIFSDGSPLVDDWKYFTVKEALERVDDLDRKALKQIRV